MALFLCSLWAGWAGAAFGQGVPSISVNSTSLVEGNAGTVTAFFTLTLSSASAQTVTVDFSTALGTATPGVDYLSASGTAHFDPGVTSQTVQITIYGDALNEANETFSLVLTNAVEATLGLNEAAATIQDDDPLPALTINDISSQEGDTTPIVTSFPVSLSVASGQDVSVWFWTVAGTAAIGSDLYYTSGFLTLPAGETNGTILVLTMPDIVNEADEIFYVNLSNPINATLARTQGVGTVQNDDPSPNLTLNDISVLEGNTGVSSANFTVRLSAISGQTVTVNYETSPGTASAGSDYLTVSGEIAFPPGTTNQTATVTVPSDTLNEANETFMIDLFGAVNATILDGQGIATIFNDDPIPSISIADVTLMEGNSGTTTAVFTVSLSVASGRTVTVNYATANGIATTGADYVTASGMVTFSPGSTSQSVGVVVNGDLLNETGESFFVNLSSPVNASVARSQGTGTIQNDDAAPSITINDVTMAEGNFGTVDAVFTVSLSAASGQTVTVNYATADGTATAGSDYGSSAGTHVFTPGVTTQTVSIMVNGDSMYEANERFFVDLSSAVNATILNGQGQGMISNDDGFPSISINDMTVAEGGSGTTNGAFVVSLSAASSQTVAVSYATADGTAIAGSDYVNGIGTLTFGPGVTSQPVTVVVNGDLLDEINETFGVVLSGAVNATILDGQGMATIFNDDPIPSISINDITLMEGNSGTTNAVFKVSLSAASGRTVTVNYATANGIASTGADYVTASGMVTFPPESTSQSVSVVVNGDLLNETGETFFVNLSSPVNASVARSQGTGTIQNDDAAPSITINDVTMAEGNFGTVNAVFTVSLSAASGQTVTVTYATANGTATAGSDYGSSAGTLVFAPGVTTQTVSIMVNGESLYEANETFFVNLSGAVNATVLDAQGQGTISNDDGFPAVSISDVTVAEGNGGTTNAVFAVSLSAGSSQTITVSYAITDGTAIAGSDYVNGIGTLTFGPGVTSQTVAVVVNGDLSNETNETFGVDLSGVVNATILDGQGVGTIVNDDGQPALSVSDVTLAEGNSGTTNASFSVTLSAASGQTVTLSYATANVTANAGSDYTATSGTLTFTPGVISQSIIVPVVGDALNEPNESFVVSLAGIVNATTAKSQGTGTIQNDDAVPSISINDVMITEGNSGTVNALFTVSLSAVSGQTVTVNYATANGTATSGSDYGGNVGTATFAAGAATQTVSISVNGDSLYEANETFFVNLSGAVNATILDVQGQGTISNDDAFPAVSISDVTVAEGNSGTTNAVFAVSLSAGSSQTVTVSYATADGTATAGSDYVSGSGTVTFGPGVTSQTITVVVNGDLLDEISETLYVNLSGAVNATAADGQGVGTILDDDGQPSLSINDVTLAEGPSGTTNAVFTVSLSAVSGQTVTVNYATANGTATAGTDFDTASGMLTFAPGVTNRTATVVVEGDSTYETDETFQVSLSGAVNAGVGRNQALGTIINDDPLPAISINDVRLLEGNTGSTNAVFTVSLSRPSAFGVSLNFASADASAKSGVDYSSTVGGLYFSPGITNQSITVAILGETMNEANETFLVNLSNPGNATLSDGQGVGTIVNEDPAPAVNIADTLLLEGDSGTTNLTFTLTLTSVSGQTVTVDYATQSGSATATADYAAVSGRVTFSPGATIQTVPVSVNGDLLNEIDETFVINLSNPTNANLPRNQAVGTIQNNDPIPGISLADAAVLEGDTGTTGLVFPVVLSAPSGRAVSANYYLVDGTATAGGDYVNTSGVITFTSGTTNQTVTVGIKGDTLFEPNENLFLRLTNAVNANLVITQAMGTIVENESRTLAYTNTAEIQIPSFKIINPYPTSINLSGVPGIISKVTVSLFGFWHDSPDDLDLLLVGPAGQKVLIMSDTGGGNPVYGVNFTFSDSGSALPDSGQISSGTFRPTDFAPADSFPSPAPAGPYATQLGAFAGTDPNGNWSLFVNDDTFGLGGVLSNGWALAVTTTNLICCSDGADADLSVTLTDSPDPALTGNPFTYNLVVVNSGPGNATGVVVTNTLPPGTTYIGASSSQGTCSYASGVVTCALGNLPLGGSARIAVTVSCPSTGMLTNLTRVTGGQTDLNPANNAAAATTSVILAPAYLSIRDVTVLEPNLVTTNAEFIVSLSKATNQTITVDYTTVSGSAAAGPDFLPTYGSLTFGPGVTNQTITVSVSGDSVVEPNETFSVTLTNPANAKISRATGQGTILNDDAAVGLINRFVWDPLPTTQYYGIPFAVGIRAVDVNGTVVSGFNGTADLLGLVGAGGTNSILITEVDTSVDRVEFANVTQLPVDISGWEISCYDWLMWPDPKVVLGVPEGTVVPPGGLFICQDSGVYPGVFPNFSLGDNLAWMNDPGTNQVAVLLRNRGGQVVDFMGAVDAYPNEISYPLQITVAEWSGAPVAANPDPTRSYQRTGSVDRNSNADWSVAANSMGVQNAGLTMPFAGPRPILISPATSGNFAAGTWAGNVTVLEIATNMYVRADDRDGHVGGSGQFTILPTADLAVSTSASASLIAAGQTITYTSVVTNQGAFGTSGVTFTNKLLGLATYDSAFTTQGTISQSGNEVIASLGSLGVNASARITITIRGSSPGLLTNTAVVSGSLRDSLTNNNSTVVVSRVNYPPGISAVSDVTINEDTATGPISFAVSDPETLATSLAVTAVSSNTNLVPNANVALGGGGAARTITLTPIPNRFGDTTNTIFVSDGLDTSGISFILHVLPVNDAPLLAAIADRNIPELKLLSFTNSAVDLDQESLTYSLGPGAPPGAVVNPQTGVFTWTPSEAQGPGTNVISITVQDPTGSSDSRGFTVVVTDVNSAPSLPAQVNRVVGELVALVVTNSATDGDLPADTVTYQLLNPPAGASINAQGIITWTPSEAQGPGSYPLTTVVTDSGVPPLSATNMFVVTVNEVNVVPVLPLQGNLVVDELTALTVLNGATDADRPVGILTYQLLSPPAGATIDAQGKIIWTPTEAQGPGSYTLRTVVVDSGSPPLAATNSFTVTVREVNTAPGLVAQAARSLSEASQLVVGNGAMDGDLPLNLLSYQLISAPAGALIDANGTITWTPSEGQGPGSYTLQTAVTDDGTPRLSATNSLVVTVSEVNLPPVLPVQANLTINELTTLRVTNTAVDGDVPANNLAYHLVTPPAGAAISAQGVITWTPTETQGPGTHTITAVVTDDGAPKASATNDFTVVVREVNSAPGLGVQTNRTLVELTELLVVNVATDTDSPVNNLTYQLVSAPEGANIDPSGTIRWIPSEQQGPGIYTISTLVRDNGTPGLSATNSFVVTVSETNNAPMLTPIGEQSVRKTTLLTFTVQANDPDIPVQTVTYSLDPGAPPGATINSVSGVFGWTPSSTQGPSTNFLTVRATDSGLSSMSDAEVIRIVVTDSNLPPVLAAISPKTIDEGSLLTFTATANDGDVPAQTLTYSLDPGAPAGASINTASGVFTWTPFETAGPSTNYVVIRVVDNGNPPASDSQSVTVIVREVNSSPVLPPLTNRSVLELSNLTITNTATDPDIPRNSIIYQLVDSPIGAAIDQNGIITWTPTEAQGPGVYNLTTIANDTVVPSLGVTNTVSVTVMEANQAPILSAQGDHAVNELVTLTVTNAAVDADLPGNVLHYRLLDGPTGAIIDARGVISWTPSEMHGPGSFTLTTMATDDGTPSLNAVNSFLVTVREVNSTPSLPVQTDRSAVEGTQLLINNAAADSDIPSNLLVYKLMNPPAGASINGEGAINWQVPTSGTHTLTTVVTDNGVPPKSATNSFSVTVIETNSPPVLGFQLNRVINELTELLVTNIATDPDLPPNRLAYELITPPSGATIDSTGVIRWTPTELQGQGNYVITTVVRDDVSPPLSATNSFSVTVLEVNRAPTLGPVQDQTIYAGQTLWITNTASDPDLPANALVFGLASGPAGAAVTEAGLFSWTPSSAFVGTTNSVTISVIDNGVPTLTDAKAFRIFVNEAAELRMDITIRQSGIVAISWGSIVGIVYRVEFKDRMEDPQWQTLAEVLAISSQCVATDEARNFQRFYRVKVLR